MSAFRKLNPIRSRLFRGFVFLLLAGYSSSCSLLTDSYIMVSSVPGSFARDMITLAALNGSFLGNEAFSISTDTSTSTSSSVSTSTSTSTSTGTGSKFELTQALMVGIINGVLIQTLEGINDDSDYTSHSVYGCILNIESASLMATALVRNGATELSLDNHITAMTALSTEMCDLVETGKIIHINDDLKI